MNEQSSGSPLRVLVLEDRWQDAMLMTATLEEAGYVVRSHVAITEADFRAALELNPDVILADYQLPSFDAMTALRLAREHDPDLPFIIVTGALGDEAAAACIRDGATDYVLKDRLARLGNAVAAALEQRKLKRERQAVLVSLAESERRFRTVFRDSPVAIAVMNPIGEVVEANPAFRRLLDIEDEATSPGRLTAYLRPEEQSVFTRMVIAVRNGLPGRDSLQVSMRSRTGRHVWAHVILSALQDQSGAAGDLLAIIEDVTERIRAQESARLRAAILGAVGKSAELFLGGGEWDDCVQGFLALLGEAAELSRVAVSRWSSSGDLELLHAWIGDSAGGPSVPFAAGSAPLAGFAYSLGSLQSLDACRQGRPTVLSPSSAAGLGSCPVAALPVTVAKTTWGCLLAQAQTEDHTFSEAELDALQAAADLFGDAVQDREAAEQLRASEERTRLLIEAALDAVIATDQTGAITNWNAQAAALFGWSALEVVGQPLAALIVPDVVRDEWAAHGITSDAIRVTPGSPQRFETVAMHRSGRVFPVEVAAATASLRGSVMIGVFVRDLTQQMNAAYALNEVRRHDEAFAARIQKAMLEADTPIDTPRIAVVSQTVPGQVIAGDFVATLRHDEDTLDVVVGDVMGHGANSALLGAITKGNLYQVSRHLTLMLFEFGRLPEPHEIVSALHARVTPELLKLDSFVTLMYVRFDLRNMVCTLVDCGHTRGIHCRHGVNSDPANHTCPQITAISGDNLPLGVLEREFFVPVRVPIEPGDLFVFYSDGLVEAETADGEQFGQTRLVEAVCKASSRPPTGIISDITSQVEAFTGGGEPRDDMTLVVVAIRDAHREEPCLRRTLEVASTMEELEPVREFVRSFCAELADPTIEASSVEGLVLAAHEAACNIIKHAHRGRADMPVQILALAFEDRIEFRLFDSGTGFAPEQLSPPRLDGTQLEGYGWYFIKQNVDDYAYRRDDLGRNYLCLIKRRRNSAAPEVTPVR